METPIEERRWGIIWINENSGDVEGEFWNSYEDALECWDDDPRPGEYLVEAVSLYHVIQEGPETN